MRPPLESPFAIILTVTGGEVTGFQMLENSFAVSQAARADLPPGYDGGSDGARTRGLLRDRRSNQLNYVPVCENSLALPITCGSLRRRWRPTFSLYASS
jgi:hypothetical protein